MRPIFNKEQPIFKQLSELIRKDIIDGVYMGGDRLPSIRDNAADKNVSLVTMMNAYQDLEKQGLISSSNEGYTVNVSSSMYVNEFYLKRIEQLYKEIQVCCERAGIDSAAEYIKDLDNILKKK